MKPIIIIFSLLATFIANAVPVASLTTEKTSDRVLPKKRVEVCFVLDTTGSMGGLIEGAKQKIWSIANEMVHAKPVPELRVGLVAFRDRGDEYVTRAFDLTNDIDAVYAKLQTFKAAGGGDTPESVNEALDSACQKMSWSEDRQVLKIIFLVGDAPPHMDYPNGPKYPDICKAAVKRDLIINTIQCGNLAETTPVWKQIAQSSEGAYAAIGQTGDMVALATPMDDDLSLLNRKLGETLVYYGGDRLRQESVAKQAASELAPASVSADRLAFNARQGVSIQGGGDLIDGLANGNVRMNSINRADLPEEWRKLQDKDLKEQISAKQKERESVQQQIKVLNGQREDYLATEQKKLAQKNQKDSFDAQVAVIIQEQGQRKGIEYVK